MARINPINYMSNRSGIPRIESTGVTVNGTTSVRFNFTADASFAPNYSGLVLVRLGQAIPEGTTGTLPIVFSSAAGLQPVTNYGGVPLTAADIQGIGIYLMYYEATSNTLQILTGTTTATTTAAADGTGTDGGTATS